MTESKICTCPSGDGSLRWPCPAHPAEQAGGDERAAFKTAYLAEFDCDADGDDNMAHSNTAWRAWKMARAALAHDEQEQAAHEIRLLANALGECIQAAGITAPGVPLTGPQLLMFAEDLKRDLQRAALAQPSPAQAEQHWQKLEKPAQVGAIRFRAGLSSRLVVEAAQRLYEFESTPEQEAERPEVVAYADPVAFATFKERGHEGGVAGREWMWAEPGAALVAMSRTDECERIVGALREQYECNTAIMHARTEALSRVTSERDAALSRVAELEKQEPVATVAKVPGEDWNSLDFHRDLQDMQPGTKLYAAPLAQAQQLHDLDKQCRDDVARALGLRPNKERGFAWSYLLASIKSCVKASGDSAQAQHSVPEGWKLVPVEPTEDVLEAIHNGGYVGDDQELRWFYQSILAAAPAPGGE
ncbi:hypothetical protein [Pseudomonas aeruginosa]|uniref:hypothetical protein n=1 Tax=Pseudomonas aeruginosa TaxID=287 RepID=UPI00071BF4FF|nr:hypothetical protein [Pseudomonas aeruginosa]